MVVDNPLISTSRRMKSSSQVVRKRVVRYSSSSVLMNITLTILGMGGTISSNRNGSTAMVDAFLQPHPVRNCALNINQNNKSCHWAKLYSTTSDNENEIKANSENNNDNDNNDYLANYPNLRTFNEALQQIVAECSETRKVKFDIISRAASAEALVQQLQSDTNAPYQPSISTYNYVLKIWAKAAHILAEGNGRGDINEVYHALDGVVIPDELGQVVNRICSAKDAADHASSLLTTLENNYLKGESNIQPNCNSYNHVMEGWNKSRAKEGPSNIQNLFLKMRDWSSNGVSGIDGDVEKEDLVYTSKEDWQIIRPNSVTYSLTIQSHKRRSIGDKLGDIEELLDTLEKEYEETQDPNFKPDIGVLNAVIKSYMRSADYSSGGGGKYQQSMANTSWKTAKKINDVYIRWNKKYKETKDIDYKPNVISMTMIIDAHARCGDVAATEKAQQLFDLMLKDYKETGEDRLKPSSKTFTAIVTAWAKTRDPRSPQKAEELLTLMEEMYQEDLANGKKNSQLSPHSQTYTAAITAWARSLDNTKPQRALRILKKVNDLYKETEDKRIKPTIYTFNAAIDACAKCYGTPEQQANALKIAFAINKAITASKLKANHVTYATLLKAANFLLVAGGGKNDVVKAVFNKCKTEGYVDMTVLKTFKIAADQDLFYDLLQEAKNRNGNVDFDLIPDEWSRNM